MKNLTKTAWIVGIGSMLAYEGWTLFNKTKDDTLSEEAWRNLPRRPMIPFALGMLVGHFVWQSQDVYDREIIKQFEDGTKVTEKLKVIGENPATKTE